MQQSEQGIDYRRAIWAPFQRPDWAMTLLWETLAMLVPLVGPIVAFGYQSTVIEAMAREGIAAEMPPFDLERLSDYLQRGIRMFVVSLLVSLVVTPIGMVVIVGCNILAAVLFSHEGGMSFLGVLFIVGGVALFFLIIALAMVLVTPLWVKAALERDFGRVFDLAFARDFMRRAGREALVGHLFLLVLHLGLMFVGFLACFVGMFPAMGIAVLVQAHLFGQLYLIYLARGGAPIALPAIDYDAIAKLNVPSPRLP